MGRTTTSHHHHGQANIFTAASPTSSSPTSALTTSDAEMAPLLSNSDEEDLLDHRSSSSQRRRQPVLPTLPSAYARPTSFFQPPHHVVHLPSNSFREKSTPQRSQWCGLPRRPILRLIAPLVLFIGALYLFAISTGKVSNPLPSRISAPHQVPSEVLLPTDHDLVKAPLLLEPRWRWAADVSVVVTWVNGSDPVYRRIREAFGGKSAVGTSRDRDNEDLRYSLRTLTTNMAWHTGEVIIVSPSPPVWLNTSHPRVRWVNQDDILPDEAKPTFNSNNIEAALHRIPGLTDRFIVFNDDTFLNKAVHPSWFFTEDRGPRLFLERSPVNEPKKATAVWAHSVWNTAQVLMQRFPVELDQERPRFLKHAPFVYSLPVLRSLHDKDMFASAIALTATHPFRNKKDVITPLLHHYTLIAQSKRAAAEATAHGTTQSTASSAGHAFSIPPLSEQSKMVLLQWTSNVTANLANLDKIRKQGPIIVTINDAIGSEKIKEGREAAQQLRATYQRYFGALEAPFEKKGMGAPKA